MNKRYEDYLTELSRSDMLRSLRQIQVSGQEIILEGQSLLNLSSNDYLGIAARGDFRNEMQQEAERIGYAGSTSSRLMTGNGEEYQALEALLAERFGREAALVLGSGYHMNVGILPALVSSDTIILADRLVHASMIDGIRLSGCRFERFRHNDLNHLEQLLQKYSEKDEIIVMVESIYSMDGDEADLLGLVALRHRYPQIRLYVDEAHAIGVRGSMGLGLAEETGTIQDIDFLLGTFGKALASMGGYIICDDVVKRYLVNRCRALIYSTALPPLCVRFSHLVFDSLPKYGAERDKLSEYSSELRTALDELGLRTPSTSHIIPIVVGEAEHAVWLAEATKRRGYFTLAIRPPTVPRGSCRLRLSLTSETPVSGFAKDFSELWNEVRLHVSCSK